MKKLNFLPIILCGGGGMRLWPISRSDYPKPFVVKSHDKTLFQNTIIRNAISTFAPIIVCSEEHRFIVSEQLNSIEQNDYQIILEPEGKDTAPACALAAFSQLYADNDPILLIVPADHIIKNYESYYNALCVASLAAENSNIVTFGCIPTTASTLYGYIAKGEKFSEKVYKVNRFFEKPLKQQAALYFKDNSFYWNSGIFMCKASVYLQALKKAAPVIYFACYKAMQNKQWDDKFLRPDKDAFLACPKNSIDYAIMEKIDNASVVELDAEWSDLGSWDMQDAISKKDFNGNVTKGDVLLHNVTDSYVYSEHRLVAAIGLNNHIIVETSDAILVADKSRCSEVKALVNTLNQQQRSEVKLPSCVHRPWGAYEIVKKSTGFLVKYITVKPGAQLSLQSHKHRSEHWVVAKGIASVVCGDKVFTLTANESTFIPVGTKHRLSNLTTSNLELIEVQIGSYLSEDDIERYDDVYGRVEIKNAETVLSLTEEVVIS